MLKGFLCKADTRGVRPCGTNGAQKGVLIRANIFTTFIRRIIWQFLVILRPSIC